MKKCFIASAVLTISVTFICAWLLASDNNPESLTRARITTAGASGRPTRDMLDSIQSVIVKSEYYMSARNGHPQSPNRYQNLRAIYAPGNLEIHARTDNSLQRGEFNFKLKTEGIYADNALIGTPETDARIKSHENQLQIHHQGFVEEYINSEEGIRQNFIIKNAPISSKKVSVELSILGFDIKDNGNNALTFTESDPEDENPMTLHYDDLKCWDLNGKMLAATLKYTHDRIRIEVDVEHAAFPVTIDPIITNGIVANANKVIEINQRSAWTGYSVSSAGDVNGDGYSDIIVGAPRYDNGEYDEGAAFLFPGRSTGVSLAGVILQSNQAFAQSGTSVASAGDINNDGYGDVLIGAPRFDKGETDEGVVFVHLGSAAGIGTSPAYTLEANQAGALFGVSVAIAGDVNKDGFSDILAGGHQYSNGQVNEGAAFLYYGSASGLGPATVLECNQANAMMGYSVASAGDINGDGYSDVVSGARLYGNGQLYEGAIFIYLGGAAGLQLTPQKIESGQVDARMGHSVATAGDVNGDGFSDVVVGSYLYDSGSANEGVAFIYHGSASGLNAVPATTLQSNQAEAWFGWSVASAGDVNGDGYADVIVGGIHYDNGQNNEGAAFVFHGSVSGVNSISVAMIEGNQVEGWLGSAVASTGDVNGDGYSDIIVGGYAFEIGQTDEGIALIYHGSASIVESFAGTTSNGTSMSVLGTVVSHAGDLNGDGFDDVIAAAPSLDAYGNIGLVFVYYGTLNGLDTPSATILVEESEFTAYAGSVSGAGDINGDGYDDIIVGAPTFGPAGKAYIYYGSATGVSQGSKAELSFDDSSFGFKVVGAGDLNGDGYADVAVSAPNYQVGGTIYGAVMVYFGSSAGIVPTPKSYIGTVENNYYGVAGAGDVNGDGYDELILIGTPPGGTNSKVMVYHGSATGPVDNPTTMLPPGVGDGGTGTVVAKGGDINGDGFGDVLVSAADLGNFHLIVYYGSPGGLSIPNRFGIFRPAGGFGQAIGAAGDVNGDGYGDVVVGAPQFTQPGMQFPSGAAYLFLGSPQGMAYSESFGVISMTEDQRLGLSVGSGGDVNGDGYSDMLIGVPNYADPRQGFQGQIQVYHGNNGKNGKNLRSDARLYNADLSSLYNRNYPGQDGESNFGMGLFARSFLGTGKGKLVWETQAAGNSFSKSGSTSIATSAQFTGAQSNYQPLAGTGTELKNLIAKVSPATHVRVRVKYDPVLALTGQQYGPWRYLPDYLLGNSIAPPPQEELLTKDAALAQESDPAWTVFPNPVTDKIQVRSPGGASIQSLELVSPGNARIKSLNAGQQEMNVKGLPSGIYLLLIHQKDGKTSTHRVILGE